MADPDYFTLVEFRAMPGMSDTARFPDSEVLAEAAAVTAVIEREVGTSFVSRNRTEVLDGSGYGYLTLSDPYATAVSALTIGGVVTSYSTLVLASGVLQWPIGGIWTYGIGNVSVTYAAGYSTTPPADIKRAAMKATRWRLLEGAANAGSTARQTSMTNDAGTVQYAVAGKDRPTGYPEVDAVVVGWRDKLDVFGFA